MFNHPLTPQKLFSIVIKHSICSLSKQEKKEILECAATENNGHEELKTFSHLFFKLNFPAAFNLMSTEKEYNCVVLHCIGRFFKITRLRTNANWS